MLIAVIENACLQKYVFFVKIADFSLLSSGYVFFKYLKPLLFERSKLWSNLLLWYLSSYFTYDNVLFVSPEPKF